MAQNKIAEAQAKTLKLLRDFKFKYFVDKEEVWLHLIREERMKEGRKREVGLICREREG